MDSNDYERPQITELGTVEALTAGAQGPESDGDGSMAEKPELKF